MNFLLHCVLHVKIVDVDLTCLTHPPRPSNGLPFGVFMERRFQNDYVVSGGDVQSAGTGSHGKNKNFERRVALELLESLLPHIQVHAGEKGKAGYGFVFKPLFGK